MAKRKKTFPKKLPPAHIMIPQEHGKLTGLQKHMYDIIHFYGADGCYFSNKTLSQKMDCCIRSVQYARQELCARGIIIKVKIKVKTFRMWSSYHQAVTRRRSLTLDSAREMANPCYRQPERKLHPTREGALGAKIAPKLLEVKSPTGCLTSPAGPRKEGPTARPALSQGASPPNPPGGSLNLRRPSSFQVGYVWDNARGKTFSQLWRNLKRQKWSIELVIDCIRILEIQKPGFSKRIGFDELEFRGSKKLDIGVT